MCLCLVLFKRLFGYGFYEPLARLVYCMVLIHPTVQLVMSSSIRGPQYIGVYEMVNIRKMYTLLYFC